MADGTQHGESEVGALVVRTEPQEKEWPEDGNESDRDNEREENAMNREVRGQRRGGEYRQTNPPVGRIETRKEGPAQGGNPKDVAGQ